MLTHLSSINLTSLKRIANGNVLILGNVNLCYVETIDWTRLFDMPDKQKAQVVGNKVKANCSKYLFLYYSKMLVCRAKANAISKQPTKICKHPSGHFRENCMKRPPARQPTC
jgi:hypothetical protein